MSLIDTLRGRDYIETRDFSEPELELLLRTSDDLKSKFKAGVPHRYLADKTIFLFFFDKSTRTRNSFEAGITQLGGHAHFIDADTSQIAHGESPKDTGIILSRYGHGIAIRHDLLPSEGNSYMREVAHHADRPVINMQCDVDHPCQTLADLMTIREVYAERRGLKLTKSSTREVVKGLKIAVSWAYAPSYAKPMSVPQGLIMLMTRFGMQVTLAAPPEFKLMPDTLQAAQNFAAQSGAKFEITNSMEEAFADADVVYPKSWGCIDLFKQPQESLELSKKYKDWICDAQLMKAAKKEAIYMHCLPADRSNEVTDEVIDGPQSVVYDEAENRLHTCKAIMALTM
ncbi:MAG: ornithine carbamoyltransferase [Acidobacteriia bacterium]|nr:ornithine carbamoyltransferase [Terriglobia bacterium]